MPSALARVVGLTCVFALAACNDDGGPPVPASVSASAGNQQTGPVRSTAPLPLQVTVTGSDGRPYGMAVVHWIVTSGDGSVVPDSSTTDIAGVATTQLNFGGTAGPVVVNASVGSLTPVRFDATSVDPCLTTSPFALGATVTAALEPADCVSSSSGRFEDRYSITVASSDGIVLRQTAPIVDAYLSLRTAEGALLAVNDDEMQGSTTAAVRAFLRPGTYRVDASSFTSGETGAYTLSSQAITQPITDCVDAWTMSGVTIRQDLSATDCVVGDQAGNEYFGDLFFVVVLQGQSLTVTLSSTAFDAYLEVYDANGGFFFVAADDNGAGGTDARITFTAQRNSYYLLLPSSAGARAMGAYTLAVGS